MTNLYNFPVLNFASPELRDYLIANMTHWVDGFGVDGFRCDVGDGIFRSISGNKRERNYRNFVRTW